MNNKSLRWARRLSVVPRWSVMPTIRRQSVAEHSFNVACTALWLLQFHKSRDYPDQVVFDANVMVYSLRHDIREAAEGDAPTPSKPNSLMGYAEKPQMEVVVKVADVLEALAFMEEESRMGNSMVEDIIEERTEALAVVWGFFEQRDGPLVEFDELLSLFYGALFKSHPAMEKTNEDEL